VFESPRGDERLCPRKLDRLFALWCVLFFLLLLFSFLNRIRRGGGEWRIRNPVYQKKLMEIEKKIIFSSYLGRGRRGGRGQVVRLCVLQQKSERTPRDAIVREIVVWRRGKRRRALMSANHAIQQKQ
jgi:hypothetical protein